MKHTHLYVPTKISTIYMYTNRMECSSVACQYNIEYRHTYEYEAITALVASIISIVYTMYVVCIRIYHYGW